MRSPTQEPGQAQAPHSPEALLALLLIELEPPPPRLAAPPYEARPCGWGSRDDQTELKRWIDRLLETKAYVPLGRTPARVPFSLLGPSSPATAVAALGTGALLRHRDSSVCDAAAAAFAAVGYAAMLLLQLMVALQATIARWCCRRETTRPIPRILAGWLAGWLAGCGCLLSLL